VALGWVTLQLTGSGAALGAVLATQAIPRAVLMLVGGALSDRFTPVRVMAFSAAARALVLGAFAALVISGRAQAWEVFVAAAALGAIGAFFYPARSSALPSVVDSELLEPANAWIFVATQAAIVAGPALAGLVVARAGSGPAFAIDAAGFAIAVLGLAPLHSRAAGDGRKPSGLVAEVFAGLRFMWDDQMRRAVMAVIVVLNFAVNGPFEVGVTVLAREHWGGPVALGAVIGAFGLGSVLGAILVGKLRGRLALGWALVAVCAAFGLGFPLLGVFPSAWPAALVTAIIGSVNACVAVLGLSWLQRTTPPELIGRVMSVVLTGSMAVAPISFAIAGALIGLNVELPFAIGGALALAAGVYCVVSRTVREAR
jgi:MFS family permease